MITSIVRYWDLGRDKAKDAFKVCAKDTDDFNSQLLREFSKHLISSDISFANGCIFAGFHKVGNFELIANKGEKDEKIRNRN